MSRKEIQKLEKLRRLSFHRHSEGQKKKIRRAWVESSLEDARRRPGHYAQMFFDCGLYEESQGLEQATDQIRKIVLRVDRQGIRYGGSALSNLIARTEMPLDRKERDHVRKSEQRVGGFFDPADLRSEKERGRKYPQSIRDRIIEMHLDGRFSHEIAKEVERSIEGIHRQIDQLFYNELGRRADEYSPGKRVWRQGRNWKPNESAFIRSHRKIKVKPETTARILQRPVWEIVGWEPGQKEPVKEKGSP